MLLEDMLKLVNALNEMAEKVPGLDASKLQLALNTVKIGCDDLNRTIRKREFNDLQMEFLDRCIREVLVASATNRNIQNTLSKKFQSPETAGCLEKILGIMATRKEYLLESQGKEIYYKNACELTKRFFTQLRQEFARHPKFMQSHHSVLSILSRKLEALFADVMTALPELEKAAHKDGVARLEQHPDLKTKKEPIPSQMFSVQHKRRLPSATVNIDTQEKPDKNKEPKPNKPPSSGSG